MDAGRRALLLGSLAALLGPRVVLAQTAERVARVGILGPTTAKHFAAGIAAFGEGLRERGWLEGQNLVVETRFARERYDRLPALAAELVTLKVDAIFALASPSVAAAKRATTAIPIVFETLGDAIATGLVKDLARPGGNVTGISGFAPELSAKRLELIRELLPGAERVGQPAAVRLVGQVDTEQVRVRPADHRRDRDVAGLVRHHPEHDVEPELRVELGVGHQRQHSDYSTPLRLSPNRRPQLCTSLGVKPGALFPRHWYR